MIEEIYRLFLECPLANAALVLKDNRYEAVLIKRDLELAIKEQDDFLLDKFIKAPVENLESYLFSGKIRSKTRIPCISMEGQVLPALSYEEFISEFFPEDYQHRFSLIEVFRFYEYPLLILNRFKTVLYANKAAERFFDEPPLMQRLSDLLVGFSFHAEEDNMLLSRDEKVWHMLVANAQSEATLYYVYQFIPVN